MTDKEVPWVPPDGFGELSDFVVTGVVWNDILVTVYSVTRVDEMYVII